jgi:preprotein translocase subunit SecY
LQARWGGQPTQWIRQLTSKSGSSNAEESYEESERLGIYATLLCALISATVFTEVRIKPECFEWNAILEIKTILGLSFGAMLWTWCALFVSKYGVGGGAGLIGAITPASAGLLHIIILCLGNSSPSYIFKSVILALASILLLVIFDNLILPIRLNSFKSTSANESSSPCTLPLGIALISLPGILGAIPGVLGGLKALTLLKGKIPIEENSLVINALGLILLIVGVGVGGAGRACGVVRPKRMASYMLKLSWKIPGIRPGNETSQYLKQATIRNAVVGGCLILLGLFLVSALSRVLGIDLPLIGASGFIIGLSQAVRNLK